MEYANIFDNRHSDEIAAFLAVAKQGSFVAAGQLLNRHPTVLSKRIAAMEARLGVRLMERSTRHVRLTQVGLDMASRLQMAMAMISDAERQAASESADVRGILRLALPASMGRRWIAPILPEFMETYPAVKVVAEFDERFVDLIREGFDAAIRIGELADSRLVARKLSTHRRILGAAPSYVKRRGHPAGPADLINHNCLRFSGFTSFPEWKVVRGEERYTSPVDGSLTTNDSDTLLAAAVSGTGIVGAGEWLMNQDISQGRLVRVLPDWELDSAGDISFVRPSAKYEAAPVSAFKSWIEGRFRHGAPWDFPLR
ncbi:DNA-binding transcriptional LysR family regulator [Paraburkholderia sp. BL23I1N1]|uniref:LysR family transcriptional regulator n=1 Tax=Paraburkholderia sp. BL23I1N1 TaxID=1938802 RepID=UPI000E734CD2|nr:LysR family transcriptional regulator [Paraburkholderia sp. BL23I1N1]RKE38902.1 DNA-binding transcriptional LysR family regulator [Paraburkholderia sp. BL23I1N1]